MLGGAVILPGAIAEVVALVGGGAHIAAAGGAIPLYLVLAGGVGVVPRGGAVAGVFLSLIHI